MSARVGRGSATRRDTRAGWLFAYDWDRLAMSRLQADGLARFSHAGFDLFSFPSNAGLLGFDIERFAARQAARGRAQGWRAVLSHHEQFGALAAALVAERLNRPGASPESVLAAQHKLHARRVLAAVAPEATLAAAEIPMDYGDPAPDDLPYPCFVKPVKGAFSVFARVIDSRAALARHTAFSRRDQWVIRRLVEPFERLRRARLPQACSAHRLMRETPVAPDTPQYNLDGWVADGRVHAFGVVDAIMVPGTQAFQRWEFPSALPASVQARALDVARRFLAAVGYRHGCFNLEFFFDAASNRLSVIECNPRLASQFGDLYRRVLGIDPHAWSLALALGEDPRRLPRAVPAAHLAASLVYRAFDAATVPPPPDAAQRAALARAFPDAQLFCFARRGRALARDFAWTGSHRYGCLHLGADNRSALRARAEQASALLGWPAPYADAVPVGAAAERAREAA